MGSVGRGTACEGPCRAWANFVETRECPGAHVVRDEAGGNELRVPSPALLPLGLGRGLCFLLPLAKGQEVNKCLRLYSS